MDSTAEKEKEPIDVAFTEVDLREHDKDSKYCGVFYRDSLRIYLATRVYLFIRALPQHLSES
jgi:hypothetical protein